MIFFPLDGVHNSLLNISYAVANESEFYVINSMGMARKVLTVSANLIDLNHVGLQLDWIARRLYWIQVREEGREGGRNCVYVHFIIVSLFLYYMLLIFLLPLPFSHREGR